MVPGQDFGTERGNRATWRDFGFPRSEQSARCHVAREPLLRRKAQGGAILLKWENFGPRLRSSSVLQSNKTCIND